MRFIFPGSTSRRRGHIPTQIGEQRCLYPWPSAVPLEQADGHDEWDEFDVKDFAVRVMAAPVGHSQLLYRPTYGAWPILSRLRAISQFLVRDRKITRSPKSHRRIQRHAAVLLGSKQRSPLHAGDLHAAQPFGHHCLTQAPALKIRMGGHRLKQDPRHSLDRTRSCRPTHPGHRASAQTDRAPQSYTAEPMNCAYSAQ